MRELNRLDEQVDKLVDRYEQMKKHKDLKWQNHMSEIESKKELAYQMIEEEYAVFDTIFEEFLIFLGY